MLKRIAIICGGTGGHFYPALSIARKFVGKDGEVKLFLTGRHSEYQQKCASEYEIGSEILPALPPPNGLKNSLLFSIKTAKSFMVSKDRIKSFKPDVVLAMGSFHSIIPAMAAISLKIPLFLHDGNAKIGKANIFLSRWAKDAALSFPPVNGEKLKCPFTVTGMPVRPEIARITLKKSDAIRLVNEKYGGSLTDTTPIMLVFGGSQGAEFINRRIPEALHHLQDKRNFQVIHIAGVDNIESTLKNYWKTGFQPLVIGKSEEMFLFYSASDFVVCRAGGSTIAELSIFAKFAVLIPYPYAIDNHQDDNAAYYVSSGAGICVPEKECAAAKLGGIIASWLEQPEAYKKRGMSAQNISKPEASQEIIRLIEKRFL